MPLLFSFLAVSSVPLLIHLLLYSMKLSFSLGEVSVVSQLLVLALLRALAGSYQRVRERLLHSSFNLADSVLLS